MIATVISAHGAFRTLHLGIFPLDRGGLWSGAYAPGLASLTLSELAARDVYRFQ